RHRKHVVPNTSRTKHRHPRCSDHDSSGTLGNVTTRIDTEPDIPDPPTAVRAPRSTVDLLTGAVGLLLLALVLVALSVVTAVDRAGDPDQLGTFIPGGLLFAAAMGANLILVHLVC